MKKFRIEETVFDLFPKLRIAVLSYSGIDNTSPGRQGILEGACENYRERLTRANEFLVEGALHPHIQDYGKAMKKIKRKKGSLSSIEAMTKRLENGEPLGSVNPAVDLYNSVCLTHLFTCGGEDRDRILGDMVLGFAAGNEAFVPLGGQENNPPREGELIYKDDGGAVVRSWLWREADRTKITHESKNVLFYMELVNETRMEEFLIAAQKLKLLLEEELGGSGEVRILSKEANECEI